MKHLLLALALVVTSMASASQVRAQTTASEEPLRLATVTRPPFSLVQDGAETGFSLDLWAALMSDIGRSYEITRTATFGEMLALVETGEVDVAAANISITADREAVMDFSHPIFEAGLRVMVAAGEGSGNSFLRAVFSRDLLLAIAAAFALLLLFGMLMWLFERREQEYFDHPPRAALFPAFWWALNLVVNGGFEERQPRTVPGRLLGVLLVVSSLFLVSLFVANITARMTVDAIQSSVNSVNDLYGKQVGTTAGSTAAGFLERRDIRFAGFDDLETLLTAFEDGSLDAVVFDAPILAFYVNTAGRGSAELVGPVFLRENYGIALPTGSPLAEDLNQSLLRLRENGTYEAIRLKWFGPSNG